MKRWQWITLFACGLAGYALTLSDWGHAHAWEAVPLFYSLFGFVGCAAIVYGSKWLGKRFLQKPEDFYGDD